MNTMLIDSKYAMKFDSDSLTRKKYDELHEHAVYLRDFKNMVSQEVNDNLLMYLDMHPLQFLKEMRAKHKGKLSSCFDGKLYQQIIISYQNKFSTIQRKLTFEKVSFKGFEFYKRNTKKHKKGGFKKGCIKRKSTPLSVALSYLARYGSESTVEYINGQLDKVDEKKREFYENILRLCAKFGFERLLRLALAKRERVIGKYSQKPIEFKSLTFSGRSRKQEIIAYNSHFGSRINSFVSLSGFEKKSLHIPVKFSKDWHGRMQDYNQKPKNYEYTVTFNEHRKQVPVNLCKDGKRFIPEVDENSELIGVDVNVKHNLFALSDGTTYDYDRELSEEFGKLSKHIDDVKKAKGKTYKIGKRKQRKLDALRLKMRKSNEQLIADMCKDLQAKCVTHIVMEDLDGKFGRCYVKDKTSGDIKYGRVASFINISSLKNEVEHIARKYGIAVSTVHASYTSKMCPDCGCIDDENRPEQETFDCIECGHKANADVNAAVNIKNRVSEAVLREKLLKQLDNGAFKPKTLKRERVKEVLLSFRTILLQRKGPDLKGSC